MKKTKKLLATIISAVLLIVSMLSTVFAANYDTTPIFDSPQNTAGTWWSGYDNDMFYGVNCSSSDVYGGDVGMRFIQSSVGLPASFYRMKNRVVYFELKEEDPGYDENELVREYVGIMGTGSTGLYQILGTRNTYTKDDLRYYKKCLYKYLKKYYEDYLDYLKKYYEHNLNLTLKKK